MWWHVQKFHPSSGGAQVVAALIPPFFPLLCSDIHILRKLSPPTAHAAMGTRGGGRRLSLSHGSMCETKNEFHFKVSWQCASSLRCLKTKAALRHVCAYSPSNLGRQLCRPPSPISLNPVGTGNIRIKIWVISIVGAKKITQASLMCWVKVKNVQKLLFSDLDHWSSIG